MKQSREMSARYVRKNDETEEFMSSRSKSKRDIAREGCGFLVIREGREVYFHVLPPSGVLWGA